VLPRSAEHLGHGGYSFRDYGYNQAVRPWLESVAVNGIVTSSYTYDANGNHESSVLGWLNLGADQDTSLPFAGDNVPEFVQVLSSETVTQTLRLIKNQVGTVQVVIDASTGQVVQRLDLDEFGRVLTDSSPGLQPFGLAGGFYDTDTGLVRFGARDYDAKVRRWTAGDPVRFGGGQTNVLLYAMADPVGGHGATGLFNWGPLGESCCNSSSGTEYALVGAAQVQVLPPGNCVGFMDDCDGMTCGGGFYKIANWESGICGDPHHDDDRDRRYSPECGGWKSPGEIVNGRRGPHPLDSYPWN
jgi:RHS repeat-associated protein